MGTDMPGRLVRIDISRMNPAERQRFKEALKSHWSPFIENIVERQELSFEIPQETKRESDVETTIRDIARVNGLSGKLGYIDVRRMQRGTATR